MKKTITSIIGIFLVLIATTAYSQKKTALRINEVLVDNVDNYQDDFGKHSSWIEIFNTSYGTTDIGGCYLTTDLANPKMYPIPKGDALTKIKPRQHMIFWADNKPTHGTFHLSFDLQDNRFIALISSDGRTIIDSITLPTEQKADISYGRKTDGETPWVFFEYTTPSTNNVLTDQDAANVKFMELDPWGFVMTIIAMSVVFSGLILLYLFFKFIGIAMQRIQARKEEDSIKGSILQPKTHKDSPSGEVHAAIAFALNQYERDLGEMETAILTINKVARTYSPWNSKFYGLREIPSKKK